ncbi:uncharacterized protein LOC105287528 isoform X2 [Ooceraea biroi]|uniref:uncharacterized protein LOC105287528 isoform X2 n=1 Tax=Ooceraea biroi TaxID=2015173 RepID=UPI000F078726|nr:uncharacterized protein LOC105287528 isoform X2 [Ooceraea biroi]
MSEGFKMGLFGSKDRNGEQKEKSSKDNSPARYAPYGNDSDTETYDTEALSMMDINDIIGVQSEQVGDSTLESEIAALSEIITDSKVEPAESVLESKRETQRQSLETSSVASMNIDNADASDVGQSDIMSDKRIVSKALKKETFACAQESTMCEKLSSTIAEDRASKSVEPTSVKCGKTSDVSTNETISDTSMVCTSKSSSSDGSHVEISSSTTVSDDTLQETAQRERQEDVASLTGCKKDDADKIEDQSTDEIKSQDKFKSNTRPVTVGGISKSLQLIGEAYNSEDSEETDLNDCDSLKDTPPLSIPEEASLATISAIPHVEDKSEVIGVSEKNAEKSMKLSDGASETLEEPDVKVEAIAHNRTEDSNIRLSEPEDSSQSAIPQASKEDTDGSVLNKAAEWIDNGISSSTHEQSENDMKMDTTEGMSLEHQSSNETSEEIRDTSADASIKSPQQTMKNTEENEEIETRTVEPESSVSTLVPELEKLDCSMTSSANDILDTRKVDDNCSLINDSVKKVVKDECKNEDAPMESASEAQDSASTEMPDKKFSVTETAGKNDDSQEASIINENCQITQEIVTDKITDDSREADATKMDCEITDSDNQDAADLDTDAKAASALMDTNASQITPGNNENVILKENTSSARSSTDEKTVTTDVQSINTHLPNEESSNICSTDLVTQSDASPIDMNDSTEMVGCSEKDTSAKAPISVEDIEPTRQLPSVSEKSEVNAINDTVSSELKDLHLSPTSREDSDDVVKDVREPLEVEKTEDKETEVAPAVMDKNQSKTGLTEDELLDRSESAVDEETDCRAVQVKGDNVTSSLCNTTRNNIAEDIVETADKTEIKKNEILASSLNQESEKDTEEKTEAHENLILEPEASAFDTRATDLRETHSQDDEEMKSCDETASSLEKKMEESVDTNEKKNDELIEGFTDANIKNVQSSDASIPQDTEKKLPEERSESIESKSDTDISSNVGNIVQTFSDIKSVDSTANVPRDDNDATDVRSIVEGEKSVDENVNTLQDSMDLLSETNVESLTERLSQDSEVINDEITMKTIDSLKGLLSSHLVSDSENSSSKEVKVESKASAEETVNKDVSLLLDSGETSTTQDSDYITNVIADCLTSRGEADINVSANNKITKGNEDGGSFRIDEEANAVVGETVDDEKAEEPLGTNSSLQRNDLDMDFEGNRLESVGDLEESDAKLELPQDILLDSVMSREALPRRTDTSTVIENSQSSSEISELESAVKFLQESEEQTIDSPLVLSPKMVESVVEDITKQAGAELYVPDDEVENYTNTESELDLRDVAADSISISEAEIISEAAKLENERKFAVQMRNVPAANVEEKEPEEIDRKLELNLKKEEERMLKTSSDTVADSSVNAQREVSMSDIRPLSSEGILKACDLIPRASILEERLKEPPKIEIPVPDPAKVLASVISPNDSLLIPKDARAMSYPRMLDSPKSSESKSVDTPRKDSEKQSDFENIGSPRIILKIAKSAIADCGEPRSPKSPKIRSATNSPNPEDSPGQKLGKIKLKLSKGGHPSIISNENLEETNQWHTTDSTSSLSPIGMKIKLSKSGDASIVGAEKHESPDDSKEMKYKVEESKRTDSPIGMKIKLSKSGDASIISDSKQQIPDNSIKETLTKHKEKLEISQGSPKRTESPIGMKIKLSKTGDASIIQTDRQESSEEHKETMPKRTDSPIGMKIKLSKTGDASIVSPDAPEDSSSKVKEKQEYSELPKRTESPIGMKIKLSKCKGGASIIPMDNTEDAREKLEISDLPKRTESPLGMKIKLSKSGDASIIHSEIADDIKEAKHREKPETAHDPPAKTLESSGLKIKVLKTGEATSSTLSDVTEEQDAAQASESSTGGIPRIIISKAASVVTDKTEPTEESRPREGQTEAPKRTESPLGMKIKLSKSGDASIVQSEAAAVEDQSKAARVLDAEYSKSGSGSDTSLGMKIKLFKTGDASVVETPSSTTDRKDKQQRRRDPVDSPLEMKIKLSKTGHPTIVACDSHGESSTHKSKELPALDSTLNFPQRYMEHAAVHKEPPLKILKSGHHPSILQSARSELTIEPVQVQSRKPPDSAQQIDISPKRKDVTISPIESKKSKLEAQLSQILPEVTIQPVMCRDQKQQQQQLLFDPKTSLISRQQMNVISQEISITQVRPTKASTASDSAPVGDKLKHILCKNTNSPGGSSDCEIIEHRPELIIVNENSNSSQDVVIIEEVMPNRMANIKVPKKRGRPRRNPIVQQHVQQQQSSAQMLMPRDPLALDEVQQVPVQQFEHRENERPKRTCRSQKSYAPPKRGRGRGRGKRKLDNTDNSQIGKKARIDQDLSAIEASTMAVITIDETAHVQQDTLRQSSELYKALKQPPIDRKGISPTGKMEKLISLTGRKEGGRKDLSKSLDSDMAMQLDHARSSHEEPSKSSQLSMTALDSKNGEQHKRPGVEIVSEKMQKTSAKQYAENKGKMSDGSSRAPEMKEILVPPGHSNWLTPTSKKQADTTLIRGEAVSTVQVIDEETRMSAESGSRSQTPARNIPAPASETTINEESQGSVLSTATTESEKVKVKNRRMEINFDPDEGPFTVDKIAEYEWPLDRKGETFMIQEQISQYLGVKSFKRKYPDLKRRVVDMEERNYLRENGLVSEAMCDMGLTAICSSEVLDVMCSDFPDQYEEYRKHMREKQVKEHSKKQKELTAAANAERNRIDLAEMAVQSASSWNSSLNKARRENRKCCLDLQTFTIHVPKKQQKVDPENKVSHYPVALMPGQYTDYYQVYTPAELRYYPLNTVLYGPTRPNERKFDSQSEGSQSDSDSESSSDDSSSSSSEGTQDTEGSQSTMDEVDMEISNSKDDMKLKCKMCLKVLNKHSKNEILIQCGTCNGNVHPSCIDLTLDMVPHIQSYAWQCTDCKTCAQCHDPADEDKMLFCDMCDRGYHIYCVGLRRVPQGRWHCQECAVCANCGSREPGGANSDRNSVAQWQHEYKKGEKNTRVYVSTLCVPCSKMRGDQGSSG